MSNPERFRPDAMHLTVLRGLVYAGAVLLFVCALDAWAARAAAVLAVPLALTLARRPGVARVRGPVLAAAVAGTLALAALLGSGLGGAAWLAQLVGFRA